MFDTHCHLQFKTFQGRVGEVIRAAQSSGVSYIVLPGTDVETSKNAVEIAQKFENVYAAVGIHPHHIYEQTLTDTSSATANEINKIEQLLSYSKVIAVGEVGLDRHYYKNTKYSNYEITEKFISVQKEVLIKQINLALKYSTSLILHNREAKTDFLKVLEETWDKRLEGRTVFHCCEPEEDLLEFAKHHRVMIGVDGDITYYSQKQEFVKKIPVDLLVLETDSPFLPPEPIRSELRRGPVNEPKNLKIIADFIADILKIPVKELIKQTSQNAKELFQIP